MAHKFYSLSVYAGITGSLLGTSSWAQNVVSASYAETSSIATSSSFAATASFALNAGGSGFPFSGSAVITGSLLISGSGLQVTGSTSIIGTTGTKWIAEFIAPGVTPEASGIFGAGSSNGISVQGAGASYILGRDVTNDIEFVFGTSQAGAAFLGSITNHDVLIRTGNTNRLTVSHTPAPNRLLVDGGVSASVYTSSISNGVGFFGTSSWAQTSSVAVSSSFATTASFALNSSGATFPFTGSAIVSGSLIVTGSTSVQGAFTATTKSFLINHQRLLGKKLVYGVVEAPEHSVLVRGKLTWGNIITLPEEWEWLVDMDTVTVQLTPIGTHQALFVKEIIGSQIHVGIAGQWNSDIHCYYLVQATRKDVAPLETVI